MDDTKPKKTRRIIQPKVRTGCVTCKVRRVKCDETKPSCRRCIKWGGICDGYTDTDTPKPKSSSSSSRTNPTERNIVPKIILPSILCRSPENTLFNNDLEYQAFQQFAHETSKHLTGFRESTIWSRVVLQASEANPYVRNAVTAIGALNFQNWVKKDNEVSRMEFAFREYDKAIVGLRKATEENGGNVDIRTRLISCILFACFEAFLGNNESATKQVFAGIETMEQYKKRRLQAPTSTTEYIRRSQPTPRLQALDGEIVETLMLFEIQFSSYSDAQSSEKHRQRMKRFGSAAERMPAEFTSLKQASAMLSRIMLWGIHVRFTQDGSEDDFASSPGSGSSSIDEKLPPILGIKSCSNVYAELAKALNKYKTWQAAFEPLRLRAKRQPNSNLYLGVALLQIHCLSSYIWIASGAPSRSMYYRRYTKHLREIIDLAKILDKKESEGSFTLDFRTVLPLMIVCQNYRHIAMRREVIAMFREKPRREGLWDSKMLGAIQEWIANVEEVGLELEGGEEYVPEERLAEVVEIRPAERKKKAFVRCTQGEGEDAKFHETILTW